MPKFTREQIYRGIHLITTELTSRREAERVRAEQAGEPEREIGPIALQSEEGVVALFIPTPREAG